MTGSRPPLLRWLVVLFVVALFLPTMAEIGHAWSTHRYGAHGVFVPALSAWLLWVRRGQPRGRRGASSLASLGLLGVAGVVSAAGHAASSVTLYVLSVVLAAAGLGLWLRGAAWMRHAIAPFAFLLFMLPLPREVAAAVTLPLQQFAAGFATGLLEVLHIPVSQAGVLIQLSDARLRVDETCNGLRFLLVLLVVAAGFALIYLPTWTRRGIVVAAAFGVAILANGFRVTTIAAATHFIGPDAATSALHDYAGRAIWLVALMSTLGVGVLLAWPTHPRPAARMSTGPLTRRSTGYADKSNLKENVFPGAARPCWHRSRYD